jgi:TonB family protein
MKHVIPAVAAVTLSCVLIGASGAQVAAPTKIIPGSTSVPSDLPPGVQAPEPIGFHGCSGYPSLAAANRSGGTVIMGFKVTAQASVADTVVVQSSGNAELDSATLMCAKSWLYKPATKDGKPVEVSWKEGECEAWYAIGSKRPARSVLLTFSVETDGSVKDTAVIQSSGNPDIDADAVKCLGQRHYRPATQQGKPVQYRLTEALY